MTFLYDVFLMNEFCRMLKPNFMYLIKFLRKFAFTKNSVWGHRVFFSAFTQNCFIFSLLYRVNIWYVSYIKFNFGNIVPYVLSLLVFHHITYFTMVYTSRRKMKTETRVIMIGNLKNSICFSSVVFMGGQNGKYLPRTIVFYIKYLPIIATL
jgi:hypothetical protein